MFSPIRPSPINPISIAPPHSTGYYVLRTAYCAFCKEIISNTQYAAALLDRGFGGQHGVDQVGGLLQPLFHIHQVQPQNAAALGNQRLDVAQSLRPDQRAEAVTHAGDLDVGGFVGCEDQADPSVRTTLVQLPRGMKVARPEAE